MKLQAASKKEILRIAIGTAACLAIMLAAFLVLYLFEIVESYYKVLLSGIIGSLIAIANFAALCLTVQSAAKIEDQKAMKARFQVSYNLRMIIQAGWVVVAFMVPWFHVVAAAVPLLFPTLTIYFLQSRGKLVEPSSRKNPPEEPETTEERLDTFEA